jgi:cytochrome c oxidase accessory protein FixG
VRRIKLVKTAESEQKHLLFEVSQKIYARSVTGVFARWRWAMVWFTQVLFYGLPWLSWNERQAILFDLAERKFHIFGLILYPQDFIYLTVLLIISAMSLFLFTSVAGRLWCGYTCPQTVYTEIFMWIESKIEGDRNQRIRLDNRGSKKEKYRKKTLKHATWLAVAFWTGISFVGYFTPIRDLVVQLVTFSLGPWQSFWILFYGFSTYGNAGFLREQVCKYMCPYARFQGVMFDADTLVITYDDKRGDPQGARSKMSDPKSLGLGDCVNCSLCVQVCPTGIDIRDGMQYECIGCAACIDACDKVMEKVGYPKGLIRYDTLNGIENGWTRKQLWKRVLRIRVWIYTAILSTAVIILLSSIATRVPLKVDVLRDRGALSREVKNGYIENVYRIMILNSAEIEREYSLEIEGLRDAIIDTDKTIDVDAVGNRLFAVRVQAAPNAGDAGSNQIYFVVTATDDASVTQREKSSFFFPQPR